LEKRVEMARHRRAGTRRADDNISVFKDFDKSLRQFAGLFSVTRVESRLAAAGLPFVENHFATDAL
jgi:hypothetical protein